jgi:Spy/CpxP family protein refolding chaperone
MKKKLLLPSMLLIAMSLVWADAPLKSALGLTTDQAREVDQIQASYRPRFASKRQERNTELRKLRRARIANDSQQIAQLEKTTAALHEELRQIRLSEDTDIRKVLTAEQKNKFEDYIKLRKEMVGSSRDDKDF